MSTLETPGSDPEAMLTVLRKHGLRAEIAITSELREHLGCMQIRLESRFLEAKPFPSQVLIRRVDLDPVRSTEPSQGVVKFSPRRFSPATYRSLQLGTPEYYRGYEGEGSGIHDRDEAVYEESLHSFFGKYNPEAAAMLEAWSQTVSVGKTILKCEVTVSGSVTYQVNSSWLYCTAFHPRSRPERVLMQSEFDGNCMTALGEPSRFARELGTQLLKCHPRRKCRGKSGSINCSTRYCAHGHRSSGSYTCTTVRSYTPTTPRASSRRYPCSIPSSCGTVRQRHPLRRPQESTGSRLAPSAHQPRPCCRCPHVATAIAIEDRELDRRCCTCPRDHAGRSVPDNGTPFPLRPSHHQSHRENLRTKCGREVTAVIPSALVSGRAVRPG